MAARHRLPWSRGGRLGRLGRTRRERRRRRDGCDVLDGVECCCDAGNLFTLTWFGTLATVVLRAERYVPTGAPAQPSGRVARVLWRRVRAYQLLLSARRPACCPMTPSCSAYALQALRSDGALRGGWRTVQRLRRCGRTG
ncbi:membrane protein insertion efficiency factor YidD [Angustibacter aerolatus]